MDIILETQKLGMRKNGNVVSIAPADEIALRENAQLEATKTVLIMRYINDLSVKEIAEILEEKENNISVRIHRGLQKAKDFI